MRFDRNGAAFLSPVALPIFQPSGPYFTGFEPPALAPVLEELEELPAPLGAAHGFPAASLVSAPHIPPFEYCGNSRGAGLWSTASRPIWIWSPPPAPGPLRPG